MDKEKFYALGVMSGTSLDGLDLAYCRYVKGKNKWSFKILACVTIRYDTAWKSKLSQAHMLPGWDLMNLHSEFGRWIGVQCKNFIKTRKIKKLDLIGSHGHTVFHQPQNFFTFQLGDGNAIHAATGVPVIFDFRSLDVQHGGQGAPLVPVGDQLLFSEYDVCINLGGIANLSLDRKKKRIAFDICFANMGLNYLMRSTGKDFDVDGQLASQGRIHDGLLQNLDNGYKEFKKSRPSLAREQFERGFVKLLSNNDISLEDRLRTFCESIAVQIHASLPAKKKVLLTGGGAKNRFLTRLIREKVDSKIKLTVPNTEIIDFKEALIFGFLGVLRKLGEVNVLKGVTQSKQDSVSGVWIG